MPQISVIIPTYNNARFIIEAVDSVLAQTYADFEIIVVDDGSSDNTQAVLAGYDGRLTYIYQENKGVAAARNRGSWAAQGNYLLFLDADDRIPANKLELQVPLLKANSHLGLVYSGWQHIDETGARVLGEVRPNKQGHVLKDLLRRSFYFPIATALVRRECFERVGGFDEALRTAEDTDLWIRIAAAGYAFGYVDQPLFQYRLLSGSLSRNVADHARDEFARLAKFFANPRLPGDIQALKEEAYSTLQYEIATKYYEAGEVELAQEHLRKAIATYPPLSSNEEWLLEWIAGYALDPRVNDPYQLLNRIFDNLPPEATTLRSLRRRAYGRYHTAAAFSAYRNHRLKDIRQHILPAMLGEPSIIRNRGFVRIAAQSLLAGIRILRLKA